MSLTPVSDEQAATTSEHPKSDPLIEYLLKLARESENGGPARAALAELRRGAGKGSDWPAAVYSHVLRFVGQNARRSGEEAALNVATLFALAPSKYDGRDNMGAVLAKVRDKTESGSIERRFRLLLEAEPADLPGHLRHAVSLADAKGVPIGWNQLLQDLRGLTSANSKWRQDVIHRWAKSFWTNTGSEDAADNQNDSEVQASTNQNL